MQTKLLQANRDGILEGAEFINCGQQVAFPTETVYGLGADARNDLAIAGILNPKIGQGLIH